MRRDAVVALVLAGGALGAWLLTKSPSTQTFPAPVAVVTNAPPAIPDAAPDPPLSPAAAIIAKSTPWTPGDAPALVAQRYRDAKNRRAFYDEALRTGGGAYLHFAALGY